MDLSRTLRINTVPNTLAQRLDARDAAIWVSDAFVAEAGPQVTADLLRLPWRVVICEATDHALLSELEKPEPITDLLVRRRGFVQLVDTNPADVILPPRALPIYLLNGRQSAPSRGLSALTRRLTMLDSLRRLQLKELVIAAGSAPAMPPELAELPEAMLPATIDWPVAQKLEDIRRNISALGLARNARDGEGFWLMVHDVIGRYLTNALFYDRSALEAAGFGEALHPSHLRFLILRRLSQLPAMGLVANRPLAEEFAVTIFKIDPSHGYAEFVPIWREVLAALDEMPNTIRAASRSFRHHCAISRRRIAKDKDTFPIDTKERLELLEKAVADIRYALENITADADGETDLNLYNSLAHAYQDLEDEEASAGANPARIAELRALAHDATLRAYRADPDNSFVIETYARSLLNDVKVFPERIAANAVEVLNIIYAAMDRDRSGQRKNSLSRLADSAMGLLLAQPTPMVADGEPANEIDALVAAIRVLALGVERFEGMDLDAYPPVNRVHAADLLAATILQGNAQAVRR